MDIWRTAGETHGPSLSDLIGRAADAECVLSVCDLVDAASPPGRPALAILIWQEADDSQARAAAILAGADDVIGPWMNPAEALARTLRLAARNAGQAHRMVLGDLDIDLVERSVRRDARPLDLLRREYDLLVHLARHCGRVQSREALLRAIWRRAFDPGTNVVQVHVSRLRAKLDRGFSRPMLHTIRGAGYCLVVAG
ncbi:MAG: winged helix-turn-helix domain-containing protein [Sphingobium sp.]